MPTRDQELAVLRSIVYASLFDYPLTLAQLESSLLGVRASAAAIASWLRNSELLQSAIEHRDGLYFPAGQSALVKTRARREALSRELLDRDQRVLRLISNMPFVRMVALSGSLAHLNAEGSADLDLFVITTPQRVWSVTLAALVLTKLLRCRKHLCMNYVVSEHALAIEPQDLFSANQIIHLRPVIGHRVFERFVKANPFVRDYYPNFEVPSGQPESQDPSPKSLIERVLSCGAAQLAERVARSLYGWHLRRKAASWHSRDQVRLERECLKLHTSSHRQWVLTRFERAMVDALSRVDQVAHREAVVSRT